LLVYLSTSQLPKSRSASSWEHPQVVKIGEIEVILHRPIPDGFTIKQATLVRKADGWYASLSLEDGTVPDPLPVDEIKNAVGLDVGLEKFLATSDGQAVEIPQFYRKSQQQLARHQKIG
jgi:putative transposase